MQILEIREHFARVKAAYHRNDSIKALAFLITGLEGAVRLPTGITGELRGHLREAMQFVEKDDRVGMYGIAYRVGEERALLARLVEIQAEMCRAMGAESREAAAKRKLELDRALIRGRRELQAGRVSEADAAFQEAVSHYRDEHRLFYVIGKVLHENGASKRAMPYLKRGLEVAPDDACMQELYTAVVRQIKGDQA